MFFKSLFWSISTVWSFIFITKYINGIIILFFYFCIVFLWEGNFMSLKVSCFTNSFSTFLIFAGFLFIGLKYLTKHHLKHSLSSFWFFFQLDPLYIHLPTLHESWLCWMSISLSTLISSNFILSKSNHGFVNIFF